MHKKVLTCAEKVHIIKHGVILLQNLKRERERQGLTQQEMADKLGVKRPTYTRYESGDRQPDIETQCKIATLLGVTVDYLLGRTVSVATPVLSEQPTGIDLALYAEAKALSEEEKQDVLDYIQYKKAQKERRKDNVYLAAFGGAVHGPEENKTPETAREIFQEMRNEEN